MRSPGLRQALAAIVLIVLTLSGVGRSVALASDVQHHPVQLSGVTIEICHTGREGKSVPGRPDSHDCCDACALCASVALPYATHFVAPARVAHFADHAVALGWAPAIARVPTPRLSQGPPAA